MGVALILLTLVAVLGFAQRQGTVPQTATAVLLFAVVSFGIYGLFGLRADGAFYEAQAMNLGLQWWGTPTDLAPVRSGWEFHLTLEPGKASIVWLIASLYYIGPVSPYIPLAFLAVLMGLVPSLMAQAMRNFGLGSAAQTAAWLCALLPQLSLWASGLRREALSFLLLTMSLVAISCVFRRRWATAIFFASISYIGLWVTRPQLVLVLSAGIVAALLLPLRVNLVDIRKYPVSRYVRLVLGALISIPLVLIAVSTPRIARYLDEGVRSGIITANSSTEQNLALSPLSSHPLSGVARPLELFGPLPWNWQSLAHTAVGLEGIMFLLTILLVAYAFFKGRNYRLQLSIILVAASPLLLGTLLTLANYGIVSRVRANILILLVPMLAVAIQTLIRERGFGSRSHQFFSIVKHKGGLV